METQLPDWSQVNMQSKIGNPRARSAHFARAIATASVKKKKKKKKTIMQRRLHVSAPYPHAHPLPDIIFLAHGNSMHDRTDADAYAGSGVNMNLNSISSAHSADSHYYYHFLFFYSTFPRFLGDGPDLNKLSLQNVPSEDSDPQTKISLCCMKKPEILGFKYPSGKEINYRL